MELILPPPQHANASCSMPEIRSFEVQKFIELVVPRCTLTGVDKHVSVE